MKNKNQILNTILLIIIAVYLVVISMQMKEMSDNIEKSNKAVGQVVEHMGTIEDDVVYHETTENITEQVQTAEETVEAAEDTEFSVQESDVEMGEIETPYCVLEYPKEYFDYLYLEDNTEGEPVYKTFYCELENSKIELFTLYFNNPDVGYHIGYIKNEQQDIPFNIVLSDYERDDSISDEDFEIVRNMQEAVNDIIQSFVKNENYYTK